MATGTLRDLSLYLNMLGSVYRSTALGTVAVQLTADHRGNLGGVLNANDSLVWARTTISMAVTTTGSDLDANAVVDEDTGITQNFATWAGAILVNTTADPSARLLLQGGSANPVLFPAAGWGIYSYGYDTSGRNWPGYMVNPIFTGTGSCTITGTTADKYRLVSNTPVTATLLTGELILFGASA